MVKKQSILFIMPLPPPRHGSAQMSLRIKESKHINSRYNCSYVNISTSRSSAELYNFSFILLLKKGIRFVNSYLHVLWNLILYRPAICYLAITCHGIGFLKDAPFVILSKLFAKQIILHQHNKGMASYVGRPLYKWILAKVYHKTKVVLVSWRLYDDIKFIVKQEQVCIIPNTICPTHLENEHTYSLDGKIRFLFLSHLYKQKGVDVLLNACRLLKQQGEVNFTCTFVGDVTNDYSENYFRNVIKKQKLDDCVNYAGARYGEDKERFYEQSDVFVFPTLNETFGLVLCEAMQHGLPCIGTSEGAIPDIIENGKTGFIISPGDAIDLANKMSYFCAHPEMLEKMGKEGRDRCIKFFSSNTYEEKILQLLEECCQ